MTTRLLAAALALGSVLGAGCYSEPIPPSTYRYTCEADADCSSNEQCMHGRCERPCSTVELVAAGLLGADSPCPVEDGFATCINGACANTCALDSGFCAPGYTCLDIGLGSISGGSFGGSSDPVGVCAVECTDDSCPPGEACTEGACAPLDCSAGQACPADHACFFGLCMPSCAGGQACPEGYACSAAFFVCEPECFPACAADEACFFGACTTDCSDGQECPEGQACFFGFCATEQDASTTGSTGSDADAGGTTAASDASTTGASEAGVSETATTDASDGSGTSVGIDADVEERR